MRFTVSLRLRPIRIAFFLRPNDRESLLRAISINSFLWGGHLNPIIPLYRRAPKQWRREHLRSPSINMILEGYLDAFDPDVVTAIGAERSDLPELGNREFVDASTILNEVVSLGGPRYGIGYFELARHFGHEELRFVRCEAVDLVVPRIAERFTPFLASVVGQLPSEIEEDVRRQLVEFYKSPVPECNIGNFQEFLRGRFITPRRLCAQFLKRDEFASTWERNCILYLNASNLGDVIDYWNLRALGFHALPCPRQCSDDAGLIEEMKQFIVSSHGVHRTNPAITYDARILRGRSIDEDEFRQFTKDLALLAASEQPKARPTMQTWFPRFWDEWARQKDQCERVSAYSESKELQVSAEDDRLTFKALAPRFLDRGAFGPRYANEVALRTYSDGEPIAEVLPEGSKELAGAIGASWLFRDRWRFSSNGLVHLAYWANETVAMSLPLSQRLFERWFADRGWEASTSSAGRATQQLLKHLGGNYGVSRIADEKIVALLGELGKGKPIDHESLRGKAWEIANRRGFDDAVGVVGNLTSAHLASLGVLIECPSCGRHPWYSLRQIDYEVECTECLDRIQIPAHDPSQLKWAYRATGPLRSLATVSGALSVLLTLRFIAILLDCRLTPAFGVELTRESDKYEIDFGCFLQSSEFGTTRTELLLAECKSYNDFERRDAERMSKFASLCPGSVIVFSTYRRVLTEREKRLLTPVVNRGRRYWKAERPFNPVLMLTGNELFAESPPPGCWEDLGARHEQFARCVADQRDILRLCDATQQLYLGLEPMHESWRRNFDKRQGRKRARNSGHKLGSKQGDT